MTNEVIFYTQLVSIFGFIAALFILYRVLVQQKDGVIQLLKERLTDKDEQITLLKTQTPDALASALADRIKVSMDEISRLRNDGDTHLKEIAHKEDELRAVQGKLNTLSDLIERNDLLCPDCGAPLASRQGFPIFGVSGGREVEATIEILEYECGLKLDDGEMQWPCGAGCDNPHNE